VPALYVDPAAKAVQVLKGAGMRHRGNCAPMMSYYEAQAWRRIRRLGSNIWYRLARMESGFWRCPLMRPVEMIRSRSRILNPAAGLDVADGGRGSLAAEV